MTSEKLFKCSDKIIYFDMDGTLTKEAGLPDFENTSISEQSEFFKNATPNKEIIKLLNRIRRNNWVTIFTTRIDFHKDVTEEWLLKHNVRYDNIIFNKPYYDYFIDDKNLNPRDLE